MPIFDNELINNISNRDNQEPIRLIPSPSTTEVDTSLPSYDDQSIKETGASLDEIADFRVENTSTVDSPFSSISRGELLANKRYPLYERGKDLENIYGLQQSWYDRIANSVVKFGATTVGTFLQGFAGIPKTINAIKNGELTDLTGNEGYEKSIDDWLKNLEDNFPNYYTRYEREHPLRAIIPFTTGSANFWGDKVLKNLGFTAGAIANAVVTDMIVGAVTGGIGEIPLVGAQIARASLWLNKLFANTEKVDRVLDLARSLGKTEQQLLSIKNLAAASSGVKLTSGPRYAMSLYGSTLTEAGVESRAIYDKVKEELVSLYRIKNAGQDPTGAELERIEQYSENAMNTSLGINMALLGVSNSVQFGNLLKSFQRGSKALTSLENISLKGGALGTFENVEPFSKSGKIWSVVRPTLQNMWAEGIYEEGGQFATEQGVYDYYTRKYKSPNNAENWDTLNEIVDSTVKGLKDQFGTTEGIENMVIGAITAIISGGISNKIQGSKDERLNTTLNILNSYGLTGTLKEQYDTTLNAVSIAKEMEEAVKQGDVYKYNNLKKDMFFNMIISRLPYNLHDTTVEQLSMLKDLPKEEFEKTFGMDFNEESKKTVGAYVDSLIEEANNIKKSYDAIDSTFKNPFRNIVAPKNPEEETEARKYRTFNEWKTNLVYYSSIDKSINNSLSDIQDKVSEINSLIPNDLLAQLTSKEGLKDLSISYEEEATSLNKTITEFTSAKDRRNIKQRVKELRNISERINLAEPDTKSFVSLLNRELGQEVVGQENSTALFNYGVAINRLLDIKKKAADKFDALSSEEGFNRFFDQEENAEEVEAPQEIEGIEVGRQYTSSNIRKPRKHKLDDDRWEIVSPLGQSTFYSTEKAADDVFDEMMSDAIALSDFTVLAINPDRTIKVEDKEGNITNIPESFISDYIKVETEQEKLKKFKKELDKQQKELELDSGDNPTNDINQDIDFTEFESKKKDTSILFTSTTSASEDWEATTPHAERASELLNNLKNFKNKSNIRLILVTQNQEESLGLAGLTELSLQGSGLVKNKYTDLNEGLIAAVYVEQDKSDVYFVDKEGKRIGKIGEPVDLNTVVFSTMPTTHTVWADGEPRYRKGDKEKAIEYAKRWELKRKKLFALEPGNYEIYNFSISRGIPTVIDVLDRNPVGETLVPEEIISSQEGLITIPTNGAIVHNGEILKFPNGRPILQYADTLVFLGNTTLNDNQAETIYNILKKISDEINTQLSSRQPIRLNQKYIKFLRNILFYKDGDKFSDNQIFIDSKDMNLRLGNKKWDITKIADNEADILETLKATYQSTNNRTLTKYFNEKFREIYFDNGLKERVWKNYQTYLLSTTYPDGSKRSIDDIPLTTSVVPKTEASPTNFKQKYAILEGLELPELKVKSTPEKPVNKEKPKAPNKIGEYVIDGSTVNTFNLKAGPAQFIASLEEGQVKITLVPNETLTNVASDPNSVKVVKGKLKEAGLFVEGKTNEEYVAEYVANTILANIKALREEKPATELPVKKNFKGVGKPPSSEYRRVGGKTETISDLELELFKEWWKNNVPNIPYEVLENIIITHDGERAWGVFENNVAKFYRKAARGTEYHEIFEAIWKAFLTEEERSVILEEFKSKSGSFTDRASGKKIKYDEASDIQAKERIADDFANFRLGKLPARTLGQRIVQFFRNIIEFFKQFVSKPSKKEELFKAIDTGKFKDYELSEDNNPFSEYRRIPGLTEYETNLFVEDITARVRQIIMPNKENLFDPIALTSDEIFEQIRERYISEDKIDDNNPEKLSNSEFDQLVTKTKEFLRTFKIEFDEDNVVTINDEGRNRVDYAPEPFVTDWKKSSPFAIKFALGGLVETKPVNQESELSFKLPDIKVTSVGGHKLLNFSRVFSTILNKLGNTTDVQQVTNKVVELAKEDSNYVRLFTMLGGNRKGGYIDFSNFKDADWRLFINFYQVFTKQKPDALIQYINDGNVYTGSANLFGEDKRIQREWLENIKSLSKEKDSLITYNRAKREYVVKKEFKDISIKKPENMSDFLGKIGINFPQDIYTKLDSEDKTIFAESVAAIYNYVGKSKGIMSITNKALGINGPLTSLSNLYIKATNPLIDLTHFGIDKKRRQTYTNNNYTSIFENEFNSVETLDELFRIRPDLKNDPFTANSQVFKKGGLFFNKDGKRIKKVKVSYIQGTIDSDLGRQRDTASLGRGDRFTQEINQNINGNYYILVPADSATEWMLNLGNNISYSDIQTGDAWNSIYSIFRGYLEDDIQLALDNRSYLRNTEPRAKELRFFKDILSSSLLEKVNTLIKNEASLEEIRSFITENTSEINTSIKSFIEGDVKGLDKTLKETRQILPRKDLFSYKNLNSDFVNEHNLNKNKLTEKEVNDILTFTQVNYIINNIELHKILFGDPYQFAIKNNQLDETKRIKSFLSPRATTFDSPEFNSYLNQKYNKDLEEKDPGYHLHKAYIPTVTFDDVTIASNLRSINPAFAKVNETDAASWIMDNTYKEVKLKNGQWSNEAEDWHQWQMAYTRQNLPGYKYTNKKLKEKDEKLLKTPEPKYTLEILKPIVSGVKYGKNKVELVLDKLSQMPLYYSMVQGTNLEKLYIKMFNEGIGYGIAISGRKVGAEGLHSLYKEDGSFNDEAFNNKIDVPWKAYGIQVENSYDGPKEQTRGSQLTKLSSLDLFDNGKPSSLEAQKEYDYNIHILDLMHQNGYKTLLERLGIEDLDGSFRVVDNSMIAKTLEGEMLRREVSENIKDTLQINENGEFRIPFEASSAYMQIRDILYSMIHKGINSPKMNGGAHVQVPATLFEKSGEGRKVIEINGKKVYTSSSLKFYTKEEPYMEVLLPAWFKNKLGFRFKTDSEILEHLNNSLDGKEILKGIGFRIPTQSLSSIENIRVKGFLPSYMGNTVVVPSEITTKAGSDFDIDKLNIYLKAIYTDKNGDIKLVRYLGSEEKTKSFFSRLFDEKLEKKQIVTSDLLEALQLIHQGRAYAEKYDSRNLIKRYGDLLNTIISETEDLTEKENELVLKIEKYGNKDIQEGLKKEFVDEMYKRSLENEYYASLERLITLPENFERLIHPVDDVGLKKLSDNLDILRKEGETTIKNRILRRNYITSTRHAFVLGKKWVGIGAVNITHHSLAQKSKVVIEPSKVENLQESDRKWLGNATVILPHNDVDGKVSMSGVKTADGKHYISDRLSGYITSFVDVAKDPYILKIIKSDLVVGTFMFLERIGVGENTALFMNQPIITKYLEYLDSIGARGLFNQDNINYVKSKFTTSKKSLNTVQIDVNNLSNNIEKYYEKGKFESLEDNAVQHKILDEFLKYAKMAEFSFKLSQSVNYDTTRFRSADALYKKQVRTQDAIENNIFSSPSNILDKSHIGKQSLLLAYASEAIGEILPLDKYDVRAKVINPIMKSYAQNYFLSGDNYDRVSNKVISSFIDYLVQTKTPLNEEIKELVVDTSTAVSSQVAAAKKKYPNIRLLRELVIESSNRIEGAKTVKLRSNLKDAYDINVHTEMFRELKEALPELYKNIVKLSLIQGTYQTSVSISNVIPLEDRAEVIAPLIKSLSLDNTLDSFSKGGFQRNNWKDEDIFHRFVPTFWANDIPIIDQFYNEIYTYRSPSFAGLPNLNIKPSDRKILLVSEKYKLFDIKHDFLLVPRVVINPKTKERVDMITGRTVTNAMYKERSVKGDMSLKDVFGYQKVKYADGSPVITYNEKGVGSHVYKLINLWGDGQYASEYYNEFKPSVIDNGTIKISQEIPDSEVISYFGDKTETDTPENITVDNTNINEENGTETIPPCI